MRCLQARVSLINLETAYRKASEGVRPPTEAKRRARGPLMIRPW
jgi:hypothetical protein